MTTSIGREEVGGKGVDVMSIYQCPCNVSAPIRALVMCHWRMVYFVAISVVLPVVFFSLMKFRREFESPWSS
jgi:hypothetical protein